MDNELVEYLSHINATLRMIRTELGGGGTPMGIIEFNGMKLCEKLNETNVGLVSISSSLERIAENLEKTSEMVHPTLEKIEKRLDEIGTEIFKIRLK